MGLEKTIYFEIGYFMVFNETLKRPFILNGDFMVFNETLIRPIILNMDKWFFCGFIMGLKKTNYSERR